MPFDTKLLSSSSISMNASTQLMMSRTTTISLLSSLNGASAPEVVVVQMSAA